MKRKPKAEEYRVTLTVDPETTYRQKAANLYQALCRIRILGRMLNDIDASGHDRITLAEDVEALSYAIREIADKAMLENEA